MFYSSLNNPNKQRIAAMYGQSNNVIVKAEELPDDSFGDIGLNKAEELGLLDYDGTDLLKGRTPMPIGSHATWGGTSYLKTAQGWKPVGKLRGNVKANHDHLHNNEEKDKDHHTMTMDAGKMDEAEWTKKHGAGLHAKYKQVHDYLHKEKEDKKDDHNTTFVREDGSEESYKEFNDRHKNDTGFNVTFKQWKEDHEKAGNKLKNEKKEINKDNHGIEEGKVYDHHVYGKVKVTAVKKNEGDKADRISHHVSFKTRAGEGIEETQGINGFKEQIVGGDKMEHTYGDKAIDWWHKELSINQQKEYSKKHLDDFEYSALMGSNSSYAGSKYKDQLKKKVYEGVNKDSKAVHEKRGFDESKGDVDVTGKSEKVPEDKFKNFSSTESSLIKRALERKPNIDVSNIEKLSNKIALLSHGDRKLEHVAEALQYEMSKDDPLFGKINSTDIEYGLNNPKYDFPQLDRQDDVGILPKETKSKITEAKELFKKIGELDNTSKNLIKVYQKRYLGESDPEKQISKLKSIIDNYLKVKNAPLFEGEKLSNDSTLIAMAINHEESSPDINELVNGSLDTYSKSNQVKKNKLREQAEYQVRRAEHFKKHGVEMEANNYYAKALKEFLKKIS